MNEGEVGKYYDKRSLKGLGISTKGKTRLPTPGPAVVCKKFEEYKEETKEENKEENCAAYSQSRSFVKFKEY